MEGLKVKKENKEEVLEIVKKYVSEVFETSIFLPLSIDETKDAEKLWKATGKILVDVPKIENEKIKNKIVDLINDAVNDMQGVKKLAGKIALSKISDLISFCFYINSYGKICAFHIVIPDTNIPFEIPQCCSELKEKDLKDYSIMAKKFFEKGMNPKFFDFVPLYGWCKANNDIIIYAFVVFYSTFRAFFTSYRIEIVNDNIEFKTIAEPVEI